MAGRLLSFKEYIGGADNVITLEMFPKDQRNFVYDYDTDVSGYNFSADYQSIVLDTVSYDRTTGDVNFADTTVSGYFTNTANIAGSFIDETSAASGIITFTIPENRYTGNVTPNARTNVVATVVSFEWETDDSPNPQKQRHRWLVLERFDPTVGKVPVSDITNEPGFVSLT